jgi:predicted enzyme related to lactoylglutathione lyase
MSNADLRGRFIWHELLTTDTAAAAAFYPKVVPWRTHPSSMPGYTIWMAGQTQVGGLMALPPDAAGTPPHWLVYVGTPSVDATVEQAQRLGARIVKAAADIPNVGRFAVLADPQGATFAVYTPAGAAASTSPSGGAGGFSWHELATTDVAGALRFYGELFGWRKGPGHDMGAMGIYQLFEHGGTQVGGMCNVQGPSTPPSWLSYVQVTDTTRAVAVAKGAGGRVMHGPMDVPGGSSIALFMDPQGGAFAVQRPPAAMQPARPAAAPAPKPAAPPPAPKPAMPPPAVKPAAPPPAVKSAAAPAAAAPRAAAPAAAPKPAAKKAAPARPAAKKPARKPAKRKAAKKKAAKKKAAKKAVKKTAKRARKGARRAPARKSAARRRTGRRAARGGRARRRR